jgi:hypothetical protein
MDGGWACAGAWESARRLLSEDYVSLSNKVDGLSQAPMEQKTLKNPTICTTPCESVQLHPDSPSHIALG